MVQSGTGRNAAVDLGSLWDRLRRRKVVQWGLACAAGAWGLLQGLEYVSDTLGWPQSLRQVTTPALLVELPIVLVIAWYHGDRGEGPLRASIEQFEEAIRIAPGFARAHSALAASTAVLVSYTGTDVAVETFLNAAQTRAQRALSLDPSLDEMHGRRDARSTTAACSQPTSSGWTRVRTSRHAGDQPFSRHPNYDASQQSRPATLPCAVRRASRDLFNGRAAGARRSPAAQDRRAGGRVGLAPQVRIAPELDAARDRG